MAKAIFKRVIQAFILLTTVIYIAASCTPYINPIHCSLFTFLALGFPFILLVMLLASALAFFCFKKHSWIFLLFVLVGGKNILATTGFHLFATTFNQEKPKGTIRLLSWNVNQFESSQKKADSINSPRRQILNFIKTTNADVLSLQDFQNYFNREDYFDNIIYIKDSLKYPYYYFSLDKGPGRYDIEYYGSIIFSRLPILDSGRVVYDSKDNPEHIGFADINVNSKTPIRFYNTHLSSMQLTAERKNAGLDYTYIQDDTAILLNKNKLERIAIYDSFHVKQAQLVKQQLNKSPLPFVFCADLNSVPSSYVYHHISSGLQDAFLQKGFGWGPTYDGLSHTLRIDVTLLSPQLKVVQHYCPKLKASDHFPLVTDIALP